MAKRLKTITAGRLVVVGCYTIPTPRSTERERKALREISSAAQMTINANRSWQRLELLLAANFGRRDLHVVLTYDDEHLPANRQAAAFWASRVPPSGRRRCSGCARCCPSSELCGSPEGRNSSTYM